MSKMGIVVKLFGIFTRNLWSVREVACYLFCEDYGKDLSLLHLFDLG